MGQLSRKALSVVLSGLLATSIAEGLEARPDATGTQVLYMRKRRRAIPFAEVHFTTRIISRMQAAVTKSIISPSPPMTKLVPSVAGILNRGSSLVSDELFELSFLARED